MGNINEYAIEEFNLGDLPRGFSGAIFLESIAALSHTARIPALVHVGNHPGPTLMAVAGVHGNEYEGQEAVRRIFSGIDPANLHGIFFGLPVCNVLAYEAKSRCTPPHFDGLNLARVFPGDQYGSPTQQLAFALMQLVTRNLTENDLFIDFHSASEDSNYVTMVGFRDIDSGGRAASEEAARHFGGCPVWIFDNQRGMFNAEVSRVGIPTLGTETIGQAGCRSKDVEAFTNGVYDLLRFRGMIPGTPSRRFEGAPHRGTRLESGATGFMRLNCELGDEVILDEVIGEIITLHGEQIEELRTPCAGRVWMHRTNPTIRAHDVVCIIGTPVS